MLNSPGKIRRIFHKKRQAFEKKNPEQPTDITTRLNKLHQDFGVLQQIANKAKGNARAAEQDSFNTTRERMLTNLGKVQKHLKPNKNKDTHKPFYKAVWQTIVIVEQFDLQKLDEIELENKDDEGAFESIDIQAREAQDEGTQQSGTEPPQMPPLPPTPQRQSQPPNRPLPTPPQGQRPPTQNQPQMPPLPPTPQQPTRQPPQRPQQSPQSIHSDRRKAKGQNVLKHISSADKALKALDMLHKVRDKDIGGDVYKGMAELAKKGLFAEDKQFAKLGNAVKAYTTLRDKPGSDPHTVGQAWKLVATLAKEYVAWANQTYPDEIKSKTGNKYGRFQTAKDLLTLISDWDDNESEVSTQATLITRDVIMAMQESQTFINGGTPKGQTLDGTSIKLLEDLAKHPGLPGNLKPSLEAVISKARPILAQEAQLRLGTLTNSTVDDKAGILMEYGGCKPPPRDVKGTSDSFIIYGLDGKPQHFYKPMDGELRPGIDWPENGGATREILVSKVNDILEQAGLNCNAPKTEVARLTDDVFTSGTISQKPDRVGALVDAIKFSPGDPKNAYDWLTTQRTDSQGNKIPIDMAQEMGKLNPKDCQSVMLMNFIMLDCDANPGNILVTGTGGGPGETHVIPIDAGRKLPNPEAYKRGCGGMTMRNPPRPDHFASDDVFLLQTPSAMQPFDQEIIDKIKQLDPDQIVQSTKQAYTDVVHGAPEMDNTVEDGSFDLMKKSIQFLKAAMSQTPPLTPYDLSLIYAHGFEAIVDAKSPQETTTAIQNALTAISTFKANGGDDTLRQRGIEPGGLSIQQKARALGGQPPINNRDDFAQYHYQELQQQLHDIATYIADGPEKITDELTRPFSNENYVFLKLLADYKRQGGDPLLKNLIDCDESYRVDVAQSLSNRSAWTFKEATSYFGHGGTPALIKLIGQAKFDQEYRGKPVGDLDAALEQALAEAKGG
jgi:hypothetical protein